MKLSDMELMELKCLLDMKWDRSVPMFQGHQDRLAFLTDKSRHNDCINPHCVGYHGEQSDTHCPHCNRKLYKMSGIDACP